MTVGSSILICSNWGVTSRCRAQEGARRKKIGCTTVGHSRHGLFFGLLSRAIDQPPRCLRPPFSAESEHRYPALLATPSGLTFVSGAGVAVLALDDIQAQGR